MCLRPFLFLPLVCGGWAIAWPTVRDRVRPLADLDLSTSGLAPVAELRQLLAAAHSERDRLAAIFADFDAAPVAVSKRGRKLFRFHPTDLPTADRLPTIRAIATLDAPLAKVQQALAAVTQRAAWLDLYYERAAHGRTAAAHFVAAYP